jgi:hypothetical protein
MNTRRMLTCYGRCLLSERLKLEEEYERLQMYSCDTRFDSAVVPTKLDLGRVILDMLHCPMRMNEKVFNMLYFAAMNRLPHKRDWEPVLDCMTNIVRHIGDLPPSWSHTYTTKKSKTGAILFGNTNSKCSIWTTKLRNKFSTTRIQKLCTKS